VDHACFNSFEAVRLLADVLDFLDLNMPPLQQPNGPLATGVPVPIGAPWLRMKLRTSGAQC
jgi:hypothetical protein